MTRGADWIRVAHRVSKETGISPRIVAFLYGFSRKHGRLWKSKLRGIWASGRDADWHACREARNVVGPTGLDQIKF